VGEVGYVWEDGGLLDKLYVRAGGSEQRWRYEYNPARELWRVYRMVERNEYWYEEVLEVEYVRDGFGRLQQIQYGNGTQVRYTYDSADRVRREDYTVRGTPYRSVEYRRDDLGRIQRKWEYSWIGRVRRLMSTTTYTYDHQGQLIREVRTGANPYTIEYTYDLVGNRLTRTRTVNGQTFTDVMAYNAANQLVKRNDREWKHDLDGNVVVRRVGNETWLLDYDAEGNLVSLQKQGDSVGWVYEYDGLGRRVRAVRGSLEVVYLYSGNTLIAEGSRQRSSDPLRWVYYGYGSAMYQQVSNTGTDLKHCNLRGEKKKKI
jgi:YD repeat-containing protein